MNADDTTPLPSSRAIALFSNYLTEVESGSGPSFEKLLAQHPDVAAELKILQNSGRGSLTSRGDDPLKPGASQKLLNLLKERVTPSGRYVIRGEIGRGAMGIIYRVWDRDLRRHLAMKWMRTEVEADAHSTDEAANLRILRFLDEAQITAQLDHASIVPVHELGIDEKGRLFFTMKLVRGRDLKIVFDCLQKGEDGWTIRRAVQVLQKICEAIGFAHAKGVIHRDLKPSNIMVGPFGEVYVMDWGLARSLDRKDVHDIRVRADAAPDESTIQTIRKDEREGESDAPLLTMDGSVIGTPAYMPPEQANGRMDKIGPASDVYSLGAMLYHLLAGHMPYVPQGTRMSQHALLNLVMMGPPPPIRKENANIPEELAAICEKAMSREIVDRYQSALDMAADLEAFLERRPVAAQPASILYTFQLLLERNRRAFATAAAAALLLASSLVWFLWHLTNERNKTARLADASTATALLAQADSLRPLLPNQIPVTERWLAQANSLIKHRDTYFNSSAAALAPLSDADILQLKGELQKIESLKTAIEGDFTIARGLRSATVDMQQQQWEAAKVAIAKSKHYGGLQITPQVGMIPIGVDPRSGLYEFWCVTTGERPQLEASTGKLLNQRGGMVMILIPGGDFTIGSPESEEGHRSNEDQAPRSVAPFFISKFETTQAQWVKLMGENPSEYAAGTSYKNQSFTEAHPVECITWREAVEFTERAGLRLPSETEWEYACRGGTATAYPFGATYLCLETKENILDKNHVVADERRAPWADDYLYHAPVGSFAPNPYGLFDMLGNVAEWCANSFEENYKSESPDGHFSKFKCLRGGSWFLSPEKYLCKSAFRQYALPATANKTLGLRAARSLER